MRILFRLIETICSKLDEELFLEPLKKLAKLYKSLGVKNNYSLINSLISDSVDEKNEVEEE